MKPPQTIAFLTPFPNTPGFTVLATKQHRGSEIFALPTHELEEIINDATDVSDILRAGLNVQRVGLIFEGFGVDHAYVQ